MDTDGISTFFAPLSRQHCSVLANSSTLIGLVAKKRTNEKVDKELSGEHLLKGNRGKIAKRFVNTTSVLKQQVF